VPSQTHSSLLCMVSIITLESAGHAAVGIFKLILDSNHTIAEEDIGAADDEDEDSDTNNNVPKGINRLSCK